MKVFANEAGVCQLRREWGRSVLSSLRQADSVARAWCNDGNRVSFRSSPPQAAVETFDAGIPGRLVPLHASACLHAREGGRDVLPVDLAVIGEGQDHVRGDLGLIARREKGCREVAPQEHMQPPPYGQWIAEPAAHLGEFLQPLPQRGIILSDRLLAHGHSAKPITWRARRLLIP